MSSHLVSRWSWTAREDRTYTSEPPPGAATWTMSTIIVIRETKTSVAHNTISEIVVFWGGGGAHLRVKKYFDHVSPFAIIGELEVQFPELTVHKNHPAKKKSWSSKFFFALKCQNPRLFFILFYFFIIIFFFFFFICLHWVHGLQEYLNVFHQHCGLSGVFCPLLQQLNCIPFSTKKKLGKVPSAQELLQWDVLWERNITKFTLVAKNNPALLLQLVCGPKKEIVVCRTIRWCVRPFQVILMHAFWQPINAVIAVSITVASCVEADRRPEQNSHGLGF